MPEGSRIQARAIVGISAMNNAIKLAADIGGTFTDIVLEAGRQRWSGKVLTTTQAPELGVIEGIGLVLEQSGMNPADIGVFIHGTTLATNALIERKGAKTAFVTTRGFRDILEQGYEKRFDHYDLMIDRSVPLVPRTLRFTVEERLSADGDVLQPRLDEQRLVAVWDGDPAAHSATPVTQNPPPHCAARASCSWP